MLSGFFVAGNEGFDDSEKLVWFLFVSNVWKYSYHPSLSDRTHISLGLLLKNSAKPWLLWTKTLPSIFKKSRANKWSSQTKVSNDFRDIQLPLA